MSESRVKKELGKFAEWVADEGFKYDGVSLWKKSVPEIFKKNYTSSYSPNFDVYYSTAQVVDQYVRSKRGNTG